MELSRGDFPREMRKHIAEVLVRNWKEHSNHNLNELVDKLTQIGLSKTEVYDIIG